MAGHPPPRRPPAGLVPHALLRRRHRLRRPAQVHPRRRRAPHRLERHRPPRRAVRAPVHRGPRAHGVAAARPLAVDGLRPRRAGQGRRAHRAGRHARPAAVARRQPRRRDAVRRPARADDPAAHRVAPTCCGSPTSWPSARRRRRRPAPTTDLTGLLHAALSTIRRRSLVFLVSDFITDAGWERPLAAPRPAPRGGRRPPRRSARVRASRRRPDRRRRRRDRRTAARRHQRPEFRHRFHAEVDAREQALQESMPRAGVRLHDVSTGDDLVAALVSMVRRSKGPRR